MAGQITTFEPLADDTVTTDAYGGCYLDARDFADREQVGPDCWRLYDRGDEAIPEAGPLYQYADAEMVGRLAAFFAEKAR